MRRIVSLALGTLLLFSVALAAPQKADKPTLVCTLTKKKIAACCCEQREGKLYCTLAKKTLEKCCCKPVTAK